jgi:hypothetical protein
MRIMTGVEDLMHIIEDGHTYRILDDRMIEMLGDIVCTSRRVPLSFSIFAVSEI